MADSPFKPMHGPIAREPYPPGDPRLDPPREVPPPGPAWWRRAVDRLAPVVGAVVRAVGPPWARIVLAAGGAIRKERQMKVKSWQTSSGGVVAILAAAFGALKLMLDGDPSTNPDWPTVFAAVSAGVGLLRAKDHNVTGGTVQQ